MTVAVATIVSRVQNILQDTAGIRWLQQEIVDWINDAQREVVLFKPDANAINSVMVLVVGTRQTIPAGGNRLLRVIRNMSALSGGVGRRAVRIVEREILDAQVPSWHDPTVTGDAAHGAVVKHYAYDEQNPTNFYVYPGILTANTAWLEIVYSGDPTIVIYTDNISIPDIYANAIQDYVLYRAYSKDADYTANQDRANVHYQLFASTVTGKIAADSFTTPNNARKLGSVAQTGQAQQGEGNAFPRPGYGNQ